ncbi:MAG TPA: GNAT family N-acetyltransferase [Myxococcales bacterium]|nr:GNAT family N-acetyltransferase [Myxococcales bacterium]
MKVLPVNAALWPALEDLFGKSGACNGCWCMYWRLGSGYKQQPREENKKALKLLVKRGPPPGLLAFDGDLAVGWCQLTPRSELPWLAKARVSRAVDELPVWAITCFFIRRGYRKQGIPEILIAAAIKAAKRAKAPALEAYPVDAEVPGASRNRFTGTASAFARAGFKTIARRSPDRPVMRCEL